ncbi:MAG: carcinine hydrolase/isopenicillin-N N-acyltransferase family protein [Spirochaetaceae bacterium]|nr:carcinine hydrolase/isopenicillin-N N-acyltransferase family protein [Spirochaetaceae bacterium]
MCDTLYCSCDRTPASPGFADSFFGKNSDRNPQEPQALCIVPRREASRESSIGGRLLPVEDAGLSFAMSKPSWIWGGEMGINERGVAIGNEAVFSRSRPRKDGILGMDILRAALASSASAKAAVDFICSFVEKYEQGGNGAYKGSLIYNNSFLISDFSEAYLLETAGHRWAWRRLERRGAISNAYCIEDDWEGLDAQTRVEFEASGGKGSFKAHFESRFYLHFTKGEQRRALSLSLLDKFDSASIADFLDILRSHGPEDGQGGRRAHMENLCIHAGGWPATATTASFAVEYRNPESAIIWFTGTPYPCVSLYKPLLLADGRFMPLWNDYDYAEGSEKSRAYWEKHRSWIEAGHPETRLETDPEFTARLRNAQEALVQIADKALLENAGSRDKAIFTVMAQETRAVVSGWNKDCGILNQEHENK